MIDTTKRKNVKKNNTKKPQNARAEAIKAKEAMNQFLEQRK